jgi:hypothetical protein
MNQTFLLGNLRLIAVGVIMFCAGKGWLSSDVLGLFSQIGPPLGIVLGPYIWSVYVNLGKKLVPKDSIAVAKEDVAGEAIPGAQVMIKKPLVNVVG